MSHATASPFFLPLTVLYGVGPERAAALARLDLHTVHDLLLHRPRRYEDRRHFQSAARMRLHEPALACGKIVAAGLKTWKRGAGSVYEFILEDSDGGRLHCRWWNMPFMENYFKTGDEVVVYGKPGSLKPITMDHPETEVVELGETPIHFNRIVPVYPLTEGIAQRWLREIVWQTLGQFESRAPEPFPILQAQSFLSHAAALRQLHFPDELESAESARRRLAMEEYMAMQREMQARRRRLEAGARSLPCSGDNRLIKPFLAGLGFQLTESQTRVLREIRRDMAGPVPMRRLLQGDVGSGKTVVAACTALMALESGVNTALMAPTEILAGQHWQNFKRWFEPLNIRVELLTGSQKTSEQGRPLSTLNTQHSTLFIGTHALLEGAFAPENLGLVLIDEQHKFGASQREQLVRKGAYPHLLVMTATPIPRTLGLTLYGDLDISVIEHAPTGRGRIKTYVRQADRLPKVWEFVRGKLAQGRQGYVVYSRLEEEDSAAGVKAVTKEFERLEAAFTPYKLGLLHGRLKAAEKERIMAAFRANEIQLLLATSIVEVGLDVTNATVMVVENADQFGLAQLHQLRGRIGRGAEDSFCILIGGAKTDEARSRLKIMEETTDGFRIAEADLKLRGPGEMLGHRQSGAPPLRFGDLAGDIRLIEQARDLARQPQ